MKTIIVLLLTTCLLSCGSNETRTPAQPGPKIQAGKTIPGILATDVYDIFTDSGFNLEKSSDPEYGSLWMCKSLPDFYPNEDFTVYVYGISIDSITSVRATSQSRNGNDTEAPDFLGLVASIPYTGSAPSKAKLWVTENFSRPGTTIIGDVRFSVYVPSKSVRMLIIEGI